MHACSVASLFCNVWASCVCHPIIFFLSDQCLVRCCCVLFKLSGASRCILPFGKAGMTGSAVPCLGFVMVKQVLGGHSRNSQCKKGNRQLHHAPERPGTACIGSLLQGAIAVPSHTYVLDPAGARGPRTMFTPARMRQQNSTGVNGPHTH